MIKLGIYLSGSPKCGGTYSYNKTILDSLIYFIKKNSESKLVVYYLDPYWEEYLLKHDLTIKLVKMPMFSKMLCRFSRVSNFPVSIVRKLNNIFSSLCKMMQAENCDLWFFPSQDSISFLFPLPSVVAIHDLMHRYEPGFPEIGNKKEYAIREYAYGNMSKWCKAIFVDSRIGKVQLKESYPVNLNKILILPYVAGQNFNTKYCCSENFNLQYHLPKKYLFYPAQFWLHKNHFTLLNAFNLIKSELLDLHLVLVGSEKNAFSLVQKQIQELKLTERVHFFGFLDEEDMPEFYRRAVALIMPTYCGPTNIPPLEAFQMACPVLISGVYAMPEQLGEAAIYFDPNSAEDIAEKIRLLCNNPDLAEEKTQLGLNAAMHWNQDQFYQLFEKHMLSIVEKSGIEQAEYSKYD